MTPERPHRADDSRGGRADPFAGSGSRLPEAETFAPVGGARRFMPRSTWHEQVRMLIAQPKAASSPWWTVSETVQLGAAGSPPVVARLDGPHDPALRICQKKLQARRRPDAAGATSLPPRPQRQDFIRQVRRETGLALEIITPEEERGWP